ncbi:MAG: S8 family peptidase [Patescibacteria group bacterium]
MKKIITSFFILFLALAGSVSAGITPNDPLFSNQWYLSKIKADSAWDKVSESPDTVIAVIDSGVEINHPDLIENIWKNVREIPDDGVDNDQNGFIDDINGWDFSTNTPDPSPKFSTGWTEAGVSHGTMVAGVIAARGNNGQGVVGVTWRAKIMALKALNDKGEGRVSDVIRAIDYAINNGADIINLSFVSFNYSAGLQEAINRAHLAGVMIVAAAGNEQAGGEGYNIDKTKIYPACYDGKMIGENMVIGVAATDALDQKTKFSSYGFSCVDISAPGISFFNTVTNNQSGTGVNYDGYWSGTSMATPLVSATLALIQQANPELSRRETVNILFASSDNISRLNPDYLGQLGNGRLNVNRAVEMAKEKLYNNSGRLIIIPSSGENKTKIVAANGDQVYTLPVGTIKSGASFVAGDINDDGVEEIVVGAVKGEEPKVKIINNKGKLINEFLAGDRKFRGGLNVALIDLDNSGAKEIIVSSASNGNAQIQIFNNKGILKNKFFVAAQGWRGGLSIASGDIDGKNGSEIVIGYGVGSEPLVKIYSLEGKLIGSFLAYEKKFRGGVNVAVANLDGRKDHNKAEIIVSPGPGREPQIKIFDNRAKVKNQFLGYGRNWRGGINLSAGDINSDGISEIILSAYRGAAPHVRVFDISGILLESFYAFSEGFNGGINAGIIKINN